MQTRERLQEGRGHVLAPPTVISKHLRDSPKSLLKSGSGRCLIETPYLGGTSERKKDLPNYSCVCESLCKCMCIVVCGCSQWPEEGSGSLGAELQEILCSAVWGSGM